MMARCNFRLLVGLVVLVGCKTTNISMTAPTSASRSFSTPITLAETERIVTALAGDQMEGREFGAKGFDLAADWVVDYLHNAGVKPFFNDFKDTVVIHGKKTANIVGLIGTRDDTKEYISWALTSITLVRQTEKTNSILFTTEPMTMQVV